MAVERDSSYSSYAPADTKELVEKLREDGVEIASPVWTIGRRDERKQARNANGNGKHTGDGKPPRNSGPTGP